MKFDINAYCDRTVMHCKTEEESIYFTKYLNSLGRSWRTGKSYAERTNWRTYYENTCYLFQQDMFADLPFYAKQGYHILEFTDFEWDGFVDSEEIGVSSEDSEKIDYFLSGFSKN